MAAQARASAPHAARCWHTPSATSCSRAPSCKVARERYAAIQERSAALQQQFSEHVLDATDGWSHIASSGRPRWCAARRA